MRMGWSHEKTTGAVPSLIALATCGLLAGASTGCTDPVELSQGDRLELSLTGVRAMDASTEGALHAWVVPAAGEPVSIGPLTDLPATTDGTATLIFDLPVADARRFLVTVEPPGDSDAVPSRYHLIGGAVTGARATLTIEGVLTNGPPLETDPGSHSLFTTSNNIEFGYPSAEDAGLWLFTLRPIFNVHETREVRVTPLRPAWLYAGWIVWGRGTEDELWIPYGKFRPDEAGLLSSRDDTGSGPFSGDEDYLNAGVEDVPGEEWVSDEIAGLLGFDLPGDLSLPLDLDAVDPVTGEAVWYHVITIEPAFDEGEPMYDARPFFIRPYGNPIGEGGPGDPRLINYVGGEPVGRIGPAG